jgi:hypothetical protein
MFQDLGGAAHHWALREKHMDSSNVLAELDPREVLAITF